MTFSLKEESVLKALNFDDYMSASDLSKHMSVSSKTVYRMVKKINEVAISQYEEPIILAETGKGYKLSSYYLDKDWTKLFEGDSDETNRLLRLLFKYPYRLDLTSIMSIDYMSKSTVERHCRKMEDNLNRSLMTAAALNPYIGYDKAAQAVKKAYRENLSLKQACAELGFLTAEEFDRIYRPQDMV